MSAEILRRAAALMRKEASEPHMIVVVKRRVVCGARVHHGPDGGWHRDPDHPKWCNAQPGGATEPAPSDYVRTRSVLRAMADSLDHAAARVESKIEHGGRLEPVWSHERDALTVARAYLGDQP